MKKITLFARYKNMINNMWADGQRKYTANELNMFVGSYETSTSWKNWNNNPYYSTRLYQSLLKHLGCVTMKKRGLWQINGPIPEWFGSFHINALRSKSALEDLEAHSIYWMNLPDEHKVNPWKANSIDKVFDGLTQAYNNTYNNNNMTVKNDRTSYTFENMVLHPALNLLGINVQVTVWSEGTEYKGGVGCYNFTYNNKQVENKFAYDLVECHGYCMKDLIKEASDTAVAEGIKERQRVALLTMIETNKAALDAPTERTYTEGEVKIILEAFIKEKATTVINDITERYMNDIEDNIELSISYDNRIEIEVNGLSRMISDIADDATDSLLSEVDDYEIALEGVTA